MSTAVRRLGGVSEQVPSDGDRVMVVNETPFPDDLVTGAVQDHFVESASMAWGHQTTFQSYAQQGSLLARSDYQVPANVIDEIRLARDLAERDDDVASALGWCIAAAFEQGMENFHEDEKTVGLYNAVCKNMNMDRVCGEFYREYLISAQLNSLCLFTRTNLDYQPFGSSEIQTESMSAPLAGVLPAENVRVLGNDIFGTGVLAYDPDSDALRKWLDEYFNPETSAARKAQMGREDRVSAGMFVGIHEISSFTQDSESLPSYSSNTRLYLLNPRMVHRTTMPKGAWKYPRPPLTRNFALLEAKRLLNIMDYALLQGGSNFIVVAKKGTDQMPAQQVELTNLQNVVRQASRTGVIVGDHRLTFDIITPDLSSLLNPEKRRLLGRKLAMAMLRTPEHGTEDAGTKGMEAEMEMMSRVITSDRHDIKRHIERHIYDEVARRNREKITKGTPSVYFPKVILLGTQFFTDYILKLRDRGDIPRKWAVEAAGFPFEAALQQRQREIDNDVDEVLAPAAVPFSSPEMGPQDNNTGRPPGAQDGRPSNDPARPARRISKNKGETVKAIFDEASSTVVRVGEATHAILEEYNGGESGRIKSIEREALESGVAQRKGPLAMVPVNPGVEVANLKALNMTEGLRMIVGQRRGDRAFVAKLLVFREPEFSTEDAETRVARWGFPVTLIEEPDDEPERPEVAEEVASATPEETAAVAQAVAQALGGQQPPTVNVTVEQTGGRTRRVVLRDDEGTIIGSEEVPLDDSRDET